MAILAGLFLLSAAGFIVAALDARPSAPAAPTDSIPPAAGQFGGALALARPAGPAAIDLRGLLEPGPSPSLDGLAIPASPGPAWTSASPSSSTPPGASPVSSPVTFGSPPPSTSPSSPAPAGSLEPPLTAAMPIVPVTGFWSADEGISRQEAVSALKRGALPGYRSVIVPDADREAIARALDIRISDRVHGGEVRDVERAVRGGALGFVRASDLSFRVRALELDGRSLVGNRRVRALGGWPLVAQVQAAPDEVWRPGKTWVLMVGGDSFTDRGVYERVVNRRKGVDYPFAGGRARVTGHSCCGPIVERYEVPDYRLTGDRGALRRLVREAELAILNHESPITEAWEFHLNGTRFSGRPDLTEIFTRAGIDWVSLANNHIKDYGTDGITDTRRILDGFDLGFGGAGKDLDQARRISYLRAEGVRVAIVACSDVGAAAWATRNSGGAVPCKDQYMLRDIREAQRRADVVIVFPHWGIEYSRPPTQAMREKAERWAAAGADLVTGAHSHVAGAIEEFKGTPVFYSLGNFIFDQNWRTETMESFLLEATFQKDRLVQLRLHPFLSHDQAQPNLLDPTRDDGAALLRAIRRVSGDRLDW